MIDYEIMIKYVIKSSWQIGRYPILHKMTVGRLNMVTFDSDLSGIFAGDLNCLTVIADGLLWVTVSISPMNNFIVSI